MFERFTVSATDVVLFATCEALWSGHENMQVGHLLMGIADQTDTSAGKLLQTIQVTVDRIRSLTLSDEQLRSVQLGDFKRELRMSDDVRSVLQDVYQEAVKRNDETVNTGHILFAAIRNGGGHQLLAALNVNGQILEQRLADRLSLQSYATDSSYVQRETKSCKRQILVWRTREQIWRKARNYDLAFQAMVVKGTWVAELQKLENES